WLGATVCNQEEADRNIPALLYSVPAAGKFISCEPMLDEIDISGALDWVVCGAETGPGKRPMELAWAQSLRDQCATAGVPFFFKKDSGGNTTLDGVEYRQRPENQGRVEG
ncbi:MAG: DUF5131 family protein, partial [Patescibacteria group bacterium]